MWRHTVTSPWCTMKVGGAQHRSVVHNVVLYHWDGAQRSSPKYTDTHTQKDSPDSITSTTETGGNTQLDPCGSQQKYNVFWEMRSTINLSNVLSHSFSFQSISDYSLLECNIWVLWAGTLVNSSVIWWNEVTLWYVNTQESSRHQFIITLYQLLYTLFFKRS